MRLTLSPALDAEIGASVPGPIPPTSTLPCARNSLLWPGGLALFFESVVVNDVFRVSVVVVLVFVAARFLEKNVNFSLSGLTVLAFVAASSVASNLSKSFRFCSANILMASSSARPAWSSGDSALVTSWASCLRRWYSASRSFALRIWRSSSVSRWRAKGRLPATVGCLLGTCSRSGVRVGSVTRRVPILGFVGLGTGFARGRGLFGMGGLVVGPFFFCGRLYRDMLLETVVLSPSWALFSAGDGTARAAAPAISAWFRTDR